MKNIRFNMVMDATEANMLQTLATENGISQSDLVRMLIRREYRKLKDGK